MRSKVNLQIVTGFTAALVLVMAVGISSYLSFKRQKDQAGWVTFTYKVQSAANELSGLMVDMETGRRGYRATKHESFLQPYKNALVKLPAAQHQLRSLVIDPENKRNLDLIDQKVNEALTFWRSLDDGIVQSSDALQNTTIEKEKMDGFRAAMKKFFARQDELLAERNKKSDQSTEWAEWVLIIGTIVTLFIVVVLLRFILAEFRTRKKAEALVKENYDKVVQLNIESDSKNWILNGASNMNDSLQGAKDLKNLCSSILEAILNYTGHLAAAMYIFDHKNSTLELQATLGINDPALRKMKPGESLVGKAATNKDISVVENIPSGYIQIAAAGVNANSANAVFVPLWMQDELKGVVEILSWQKFSENELALFRLMSNNIAISINSAQAEAETKLLLEEVQEQKEILEAQQEELRQTNEELTKQSEELQASEEELKVQEEELRQINAELEEKHEAVESALKALDAKAKELELTSKFKSEFLANMSHELRTPLNSILILAKLLNDNTSHNLTQKQAEYAGIIYKSGNDLLELINDILDLSKIEAGKVEINFDEVQLKSIEEDMRFTFKAMAQQKKVHFSTHIDPELPFVLLTDKQRLEQVIKNLLSNAFKFTPENGNVSLNFTLKDKSSNLIAISVKDSGIGIPPEKQQLIFQAFQQADGSTSRRYGGTGLGLSISRELMHLLGGKIELISETGKGSEFTLMLPLNTRSVQNRQVKQDHQPASIIQSVSPQSFVADDRDNIQSGDRSMLIIEDDQNFASILRDFSHSKGYKTIVALAGDEGLNCASRYLPSAIILDMGLPGMDGATVLEHLKARKETAHIPVHIISGAKDIAALDDKAVAWLEKPVSESDLNKAFEKIQEILQAQLRKVLVCSTDQSLIKAMQQLVKQRNREVELEHAATMEEAQQKCTTVNCDCIVVDMGKDVEHELKNIKALKKAAAASAVPLIICVDKDISTSLEMELKKLSDVVIRTSSSSNERLMEELELFLYKVEDNTGLPQLKTAESSGTELAGKKVLLVDDDMRNVFSLNAALEMQQVNVVTASDGNEAIAVLKEHKDVNLVLMDIMMPDMDGYEAIKHIRKKMGLVKLPIIALTAKAMSEDKEKILEAGASDYITKPVNLPKLFSLMRVWVAQ